MAESLDDFRYEQARAGFSAKAVDANFRHLTDPPTPLPS